MIKVTRERFYRVFRDKKYFSVNHKQGWCSYTELSIYDNTDNRLVGRSGEGSYENTYEVIEELCCRKDLLHHYKALSVRLQREKDSLEAAAKDRREYEALSWWGKLKLWWDEKTKARHRRKYPGLMEFTEDGNIIAYNLHEMDSYIEEMFYNYQNKPKDE